MPSVGKLRIAMLFVDFPDAVADYSTRVEAEHTDNALFWRQTLATTEEYSETVSYGKLDVELVPLHGWLRARHCLSPSDPLVPGDQVDRRDDRVHYGNPGEQYLLLLDLVVDARLHPRLNAAYTTATSVTQAKLSLKEVNTTANMASAG